jgi:hypothetical protein
MGKGAVESYKRDIRLNDRENEMKTEEKDAEEGKKAMTFDVRELIKKDKITVKLNGECNFLFWLKCITLTTERIPPNTCELKLTTMIQNSIEDKERQSKGQDTAGIRGHSEINLNTGARKGGSSLPCLRTQEP